MTDPNWGDERLDTAFRSKFDGPAPSTLESDVHARIVGTDTPVRAAACLIVYMVCSP